MTNALDDLLPQGGEAFKFNAIGDTAKGKLIAAERKVVTKYGSDDPELKKDGSVKTQLVLTLEQEDGETTRVFCKPDAEYKLTEAVRASGAPFEIGGTVAIQYSEDKPSETKGYNPQKIFKAEYRPAPKNGPAVADLL